MDALRRALTDQATYRRLGYLLLGFPLGIVWFTALVTLWSLCLGLMVTPLVIPMLFGLAFVTRGLAAVETDLARGLLEVDVRRPAPAARPGGFWARVRALFGPDFWRAQVFLWLRAIVGFPVSVVFVALLAGALGMICAPLWVPFVPDGAQFGTWHAHTLLQSLVVVPIGLVLLPVTVAVARPVGDRLRPVVAALLGSPAGAGVSLSPQGRSAEPYAPPSRRGLAAHAVGASALIALTIVIWAVTSLGYFWPVWIVLPLATTLGLHGWLVVLGEQPQLLRRFHGSLNLARSAGAAAVLWLFTCLVWLVTERGYFWPIWTLLGLGLLVGAEAAAVLLGSPGSAEMAERIETLETSRAGAVTVQDSELRRIERDLHDGAQARLVALGMSLGMAEQKLGDDPEQASQLLAEARAGAEQALRELRDLARGIHPPVLTDRGLEAALTALANSTPLHVSLAVDVPVRPPSAVESAAYFVAAEALTNAAKHAQADWLDIRIARIGHRLELEITDDGVGGANPDGTGLVGLRRRVQALDGKLTITSPPGGPTTVYAELPCV